MEITKNELRKQALESRNALSVSHRESCSSQIAKILFTLPEYLAATRLLLYASYGSEVDTVHIARQALADKKELYFPKVFGDEMSFIQVTELSDLEAGYRGIPEPCGCVRWKDTMYASTLMVLPGVAFDKSHHRIGYGKGFYDRFLSDCKRHNAAPKSIALCFQAQVYPDVPAKAHDYLPDHILTENGVF